MRWLVTVILGLVLAGCTTAPRAPDDCFRVRLPDAQGLTALLEAGRRSELDTALVCLAREVAGRPESRAPFVAWVREHGADIANLGGYQAWLKATQLAYERLPGVELPAEWAAGGLRLESATPSPDARYLAAHLTGPDGKAYTGWWAPGST